MQPASFRTHLPRAACHLSSICTQNAFARMASTHSCVRSDWTSHADGVWRRLLTAQFARIGQTRCSSNARDFWGCEIVWGCFYLHGVGVAALPYLDRGGLFDATGGGIGGSGESAKHGLAFFGRRVRVCVELRHVRRSVQEVVSLEDDVKLRHKTPVVTELSNKNSTLTHARGPSRPATMHARVFVEAEREGELETSYFASTSTVTDSRFLTISTRNSL